MSRSHGPSWAARGSLSRVVAALGIPPILFARSSFLFAAILAGQAISLAVQVAVARYVGPASYGIYSYAFTVANLLALLAAWGGDRTLVRFVSEYESRGLPRMVRAVVIWTLSRMGAAAAVAGICMGAAGWMLAAGEPERALAFVLAAASLPLLVTGNLAENALRAFGAQAWANLPNRVSVLF